MVSNCGGGINLTNKRNYENARICGDRFDRQSAGLCGGFSMTTRGAGRAGGHADTENRVRQVKAAAEGHTEKCSFR